MNNIFNFFSINGGLAFGSALSVYKPYINYTWEMLPNAKVKNSGTSGVDLQLYSGNPLDFQGSQAVVVDDVNSTNFDIRNDFTLLLTCKPSSSNNTLFGNNTLDTKFLLVTRYNDSIGTRFAYNDTVYKFKDIETEAEHLSYKCLGITKSGTTLTFYWNGEVTATYTNISLPSANFFNNLILGSRAVGNLAYDGAYDNFYLFDSVLDADTIKKHTEYPNDFYQDMVNDNRTLFCTDFRGTAGYIADDKNKVVGSELVTNEWLLTGTASYDTNEISLLADNDSVRLQTIPAGFNIFVLTYTVLTTNGLSLDMNGAGAMFISSLSGEVGTHTYILSSANNISTRLYLSSNGFVGTIQNNVSLKQLSGVYPITNYSATQRTNFTQVNKGLQDLTRSFDSNGFFVDNVSYLNGNGKGYGDTGWIPSASEDFTIEITIDTTGDTWQLHGNTNFRIGTSPTKNDLIFYTIFGGGYMNIYGQPNISNVVFLYNSLAKTYSVYVNKVLKLSDIVTVADTQDTNGFGLFGVIRNTGVINKGTKELSNFKVHKKLLTDEEITQ